MIITISGYPGSGKSTVGKQLAKKLKYRYYSIGAMRRAMAKERGMTLQEFNVLGESQAFTDRDIDKWQERLGQTKDNLVVEGRTSFHFIPHSVKLFFYVDLATAAQRIFGDASHARRFEASHHYTNARQLEHGLRGRMASDTRRYRKYYGLNIFHPKHYDLYLDTTKLSPKETLKEILVYLAKVSQYKEKGDSVGKKHALIPKQPTSKGRPRKSKITSKVSTKKAVKRR